MSKIIYIPLEHIDQRYTTHLDSDIINYLESNNKEYIRIYPDIVPSRKLPSNMFLDAPFTCKFKSLQLAKISELFELNEINDGDTFFFSDLWFPGLEMIPYIAHFNNIKVSITGILHAGSWTDTDEVRNLERWAKNFEDIILDITDKIFVGSVFIKNDLLKKRFVHKEKIYVTPLPLDINNLNEFQNIDILCKKDIIIFNGRNHPEKQPWLFEELKQYINKKYLEIYKTTCPYRFIWTHKLNLDKNSYYKLLSESKCVVSFALQENYGYGIAEAVHLGCLPILPNRLVYPEMYDTNCLYDNFNELVNKLFNVMNNYEKLIQQPITKLNLNTFDSINKWFNE
jgi:glycosyltransferase involved in cell wall biosynthesis